MIKIRLSKKSDYNDIKKLFYKNKMKMISKSNWLNLWDNPELKKIKHKILGFVLQKNNKIVGHIGSYPVLYSHYNKKLTCNILHGWVIEPKYRNYSFFLLNKYFLKINSYFFLSTTTNPTAAKVLETIKWERINLKGLTQASFIIFNSKKFLSNIFLNKNIYFKKIIIIILSQILNFIIRIQKNKIISIKSNKKIAVCNKIDKKFDVFWQKYKAENKNKILFIRNMLWLKWVLKEYISSGKLKIVTISHKNKLYGYCMFAINEKNKIRFAKLVDILILRSHQDLLLPLISRSITLASENKCAFIEFKNTYHKNLKLFDYFYPLKIQLSHNYFYLKLKNVIKNKNFKIKNLHLSSIDGDTMFND